MGHYFAQIQPFKSQPHKMIKHTQAILWQQATNNFSVFDHFIRLALKGLTPSHNVFCFAKNFYIIQRLKVSKSFTRFNYLSDIFLRLRL